MFEKWSKEGFDDATKEAEMAHKPLEGSDKYGSREIFEENVLKRHDRIVKADKKVEKILGVGMKEAGEINEQYDEKLLNVNKSIDDLYAFRQAELDMTGRQAAEAEIKDLENILNERKKLFEAEYEQKEN